MYVNINGLVNFRTQGLFQQRRVLESTRYGSFENIFNFHFNDSYLLDGIHDEATSRSFHKFNKCRYHGILEYDSEE